MLTIADVLDEPLLQAIRGTLEDPDLFEDGAATAGWAARTVKSNLQARADPRVSAILKTIHERLMAHAVFKTAARPKSIPVLRLSRYEAGMAYGWHVDEPIMEGVRTDLSFTLFLSDPSAYDGGALILDEASGESEAKLPAGSLVLYPTTALHRVSEVTRGTRLVAFGWVRSYIRSHEARDCLFDLEIATRDIFAREGKSQTFDRLTKVKTQLVRLWADD